MTEPTTPHDAYAKNTFRRISPARGFLRNYFPPQVSQRLDWKTLSVEPESLVSDSLQNLFSDIRYSIQPLGEPRPQQLCLLFEHKRRVDYKTPRQILDYIYHILSNVEPTQPLPGVLPIVLLQSGRWRREASLASEYGMSEDLREALSPYLLNFQMRMVELSQLQEHELCGTLEGRLALALLKSVGENDPLAWTRFPTIMRDVAKRLARGPMPRFVRRAWSYLFNTIPREELKTFRRSLDSLKTEYQTVEESMKTIAQHFEETGIDIGRRRMLAEFLARQHEKWTSQHAQKLECLSAEQFEELTEAAFSNAPWEHLQQLLDN